MHASWNAIIRSRGDRFHTVFVMDIVIALAVLPVLFFVPLPTNDVWPYIILSGAIHVAYSMLLAYLYAHGELGQVYPIARGSSPLLVTLGAALFAQEHLHPMAYLGVLLVSGGILSLAHRKLRSTRTAVALALTTGICIACYTVTDGLGARLNGHAIAYSLWMFFAQGVGMFILWIARLRHLPLFDFRARVTQHATLGGAVALIAYTIVIWAMSVSPMGVVSALRETSVVFAALIGAFFLKEKLRFRRIAACTIIAIGTACLA